MRATRVGDDVTIEFTNIDGGAQSPQSYVCSGAPAPEAHRHRHPGAMTATPCWITSPLVVSVKVTMSATTACSAPALRPATTAPASPRAIPAVRDTPVCDEDNGTCVECLTDDNCTEGQFCDEGICRFPCELFVTYKEIRAEKLTKPRKVVLNVTSADEALTFSAGSISARLHGIR